MVVIDLPVILDVNIVKCAYKCYRAVVFMLSLNYLFPFSYFSQF